MKIRYSLRAIRELARISAYPDERNPQGAQRVRTAIFEAIEWLERSPRAGRRRMGGKFRKLVVNRYPYLIYYTFNEKEREVAIADVRHAARRRRYRDA